MLGFNVADPTALTLLGTSAIPGEFPNTVAASLDNNLVCAATTGAVSGVSCANFIPGENGALGEMNNLRPLTLGAGQSTPPVDPLNTVSQGFFNEAEDSLFVTVNGDPAVNNTGFFSSFLVEVECSENTVAKKNARLGRRNNAKEGVASILAEQDVRSSPNGTSVLFSSLSIPGSDNNVFATDASFGAGILRVDADDTADLITAQAIDGQAATCWVTISAATNTAFVTDVAVNRIVEMSLEDASIVQILDISEGDGLIDLRASGNFVYALSRGSAEDNVAAVAVVDVSGGPGIMVEVERVALDGIAGARAMGMMIL